MISFPGQYPTLRPNQQPPHLHVLPRVHLLPQSCRNANILTTQYRLSTSPLRANSHPVRHNTLPFRGAPYRLAPFEPI